MPSWVFIILSAFAEVYKWASDYFIFCNRLHVSYKHYQKGNLYVEFLLKNITPCPRNGCHKISPMFSVTHRLISYSSGSIDNEHPLSLCIHN